jgi:hypothetical protein
LPLTYGKGKKARKNQYGGLKLPARKNKYYPRVWFTTKATTAMIKKTTNNIFAMPAALAAMPVNPNIAAIKAIIKKTIA